MGKLKNDWDVFVAFCEITGLKPYKASTIDAYMDADIYDSNYGLVVDTNGDIGYEPQLGEYIHSDQSRMCYSDSSDLDYYYPIL